jgi:Transposase DDE domain
LESEAKAKAAAERAQYEKKKAIYDAKTGRRGRPPKPPDETPPPDRQSNLTDPDSALMRKSKAHEYRQAYNPQLVVCAEGSQLIVAVNMATAPSDQPSFAETILAMEKTIGLPHTVLADAGYASGAAVATLEANNIEPLVAIARTQPHRPYDFRPPPEPKPGRRIAEPWRLAMKKKLDSEDGKARYKKRKQTVEPVIGIIKSAMGFTRFHLRGLEKVASEWLLVALAYNCRRLFNLQPA